MYVRIIEIYVNLYKRSLKYLNQLSTTSWAALKFDPDDFLDVFNPGMARPDSMDEPNL